MEKDKKITIRDYYKTEKETEKLYALLQKHCNLSDAEYWCLMFIRNENCNYQHEICNQLFMSKQTINSALKQLIKKGYIEMNIPEKNHRLRQINFTEKGIKFTKEYIDVVSDIENKVWSNLTSDEQNTLLNIANKMNYIFKQEIDKLIQK